MTFEELEGLLRPLLQQHLQVSTASCAAAAPPLHRMLRRVERNTGSLAMLPILSCEQQVPQSHSDEPAAMELDGQDADVSSGVGVVSSASMACLFYSGSCNFATSQTKTERQSLTKGDQIHCAA